MVAADGSCFPALYDRFLLLSLLSSRNGFFRIGAAMGWLTIARSTQEGLRAAGARVQARLDVKAAAASHRPLHASYRALICPSPIQARHVACILPSPLWSRMHSGAVVDRSLISPHSGC